MIIEKPNFFVFTGGPGVGKTTLLRHLAAMGELTVEENARAVIRDEVADGGTGVPWGDNDRFVALTFARDLAAFEARAGDGRRLFFDRGLFDMVGANGTTPPPALLEAVRTRRYSSTVFVFPPWREIYAVDGERKQGWPEAEATFGKVMTALPALGYAPVVVPVGTVEARAAFVLARARTT